MAKNTFLDWDTNATNNTDIGGIGVLGTNAVSNFDDAFRTLMAQLRRDLDNGVVYAAKSGNYTAVANDNNAVHRYTANATLTLTAAATLAADWHYTVIADGGDVTVDPNASETIDGAATLIVPNGTTAFIICNGSAFFTQKTLSPIQPQATIASATTTDLGTVGSQNVTVTGTTTITGLGTVTAGIFRRVRFSGILTLTHNATSLILLGGANITTAAGDIAEFVSEGSGNWRCVGYSQAARNPTFPVYLPIQTATGIGTLDWTIPKGTTEITINFMGVSTNNTGSVILRLGTGGSPDTTGYEGSVASVSNALLFSSGTGFFDFTSDAANLREGKIVLTLADPSTNTWTVSYQLGLSDTANVRNGGGRKSLSGVLDIVRLTMSTGQFDAGKIGVICR